MEGVEPSLVEPESTVLPLDDIPSRTEKGWVGRIRTYAYRDQNPVPYRLATTQSDEINGGEERIRTSGPEEFGTAV